MKMKNKQNEETVQTHCAKLLEAYAREDVCWFAVPNGGLRPKRTAFKLKQQGVKRGVSDLFFIINGKSIGLEIKPATGGVQSDKQSDWQERLERAGGFYYLARGLSEAVVIMNRIGAFRMPIKLTSETVTQA